MLNRLHGLYEELKKDGVIFCFSGPASHGVMQGVGQALRKKMEIEEVGMTSAQRIFSLFVEQMQNIIQYSDERTLDQGGMPGFGYGMVAVGRENGSLYVICGNQVSASRSEKMLERLDRLSAMSRQELKDYYKRERRRDPDEGSKGAGLGFIEMFRRASAPLEYRATPIDGESVFFSIKARG